MPVNFIVPYRFIGLKYSSLSAFWHNQGLDESAKGQVITLEEFQQRRAKLHAMFA